MRLGRHAALVAIVQLVGATTACAMWVALALPGMHLVPGLSDNTDASVSISLQSALLGIDDHTTSSTTLSPSLLQRHGVAAQAVLLAVPLNKQLQLHVLVEAAAQTTLPNDTTPAPPTALGVSTSPATPPQSSPSDSTPTPVAPPAPVDSSVPAPLPPAPKKSPVTPPIVDLQSQAIVFASTAPADATVGGASYAISAVADSGLPVVFTVDPSSAGVCVVIGTTVLPLGEGTCVIDANQPGDDMYAAASQVQQSFTIRTPLRAPSTQSISFLSRPPAGAVVGGGPYTLNASASSGLAVTYSTSAGSADVCHLVNGAVRFVGAGTCRIYADQDGDAIYLAAPQAQQWFTVGLVPQTIAFTSTPPSSADLGDPPYIVSATASSGLPVVFSADSSSAAVCTVSGASVVVVGAGTCIVNASQFGNLTYASVQVQQSFTVGGGAPSQSVQTIQFSSVPPAAAVVGGTPYTLGATASSGLPVTFSADATSAGICSVSGTTVTFTGAGTCIIDADQPGDANYLAAAQAQQSFPVTLVPQAVSFTSTPPAAAVIGDPAYTIAASASSGLGVSFSLAAGSAGVCALTGSSVSFVSAGTCTIDADQAGNSTYGAATQVQQSLTVVAPSASPQSITFTSTAPASATVGGATYSVSAAASSGLAVSFTVDATSSSVCTLTGTAVSFTNTGTCTIDADQSGNTSYLAAPQTQQSFAVGLASQAISFTSTAPSGIIAGDPAYTVTASATSGLAVVFSADSSSAGVCTVSGSSVSFVGTGTCTVNADQAGNGTYAAAARVQQSFGVGQPSAPSVQSITFTSTAPSSATVGGATYTVSAIASSGLAAVFSADPTSAGVCTVSGATVTPVGTGTCTIDANQPGNANYHAAPQEQQSFTVGLTPQSISFTSTPPAAATVGGASYIVTASATSGLAVSFTIAAGSASVCSISGATVSFTGAGTCAVNAGQAGNASYAAAAQVQQSFTVTTPSKSSQTITFTAPAPSSAAVGGTAYHVTAAASSGLVVSFSIAAGSTGVCSISGNTVSFTGTGTCVVNADQAGNASYLAAPQVQQSFGVGLQSQSITFTSTAPGSAGVGDPAYTVAATASSGLAVTFSIAVGSAGVCSISGTTVSISGAGTCVVNADQAGNASYAAAAQVQQSFAVGKGSQTITFTSTPGKYDRNDPPYIVAATATSGLAVTFTTDSSSSGVCSVSGNTVSFQGRGTCIVYANQAGNANWLPAPQTQQVFDVKNHTPG
ncbi:MAG TPA: hypothetical protein VGH82_13740 [Gaiellaceae bacterium]|jgi:hypothetical protein